MHRFGQRIGWFVVLVVLVSLAGASTAGAAQPGSASGQGLDHGSYSLVISPGPATAVGSGQTVSITATLTNQSHSRTLGSADLFAPFVALHAPPFKVVSATASAGTATLSSNCGIVNFPLPCVQLRNLGLAPHASVTVSMQVQTPACQQGSRFVWLALARQGGNFDGDFLIPDLVHSQLRTALDGACKLVFGTQPHNAVVGQPITGSDDDTSGSPVTVQVEDANNHVVTTSSAQVTLAIGTNAGPGGKLSGTTTVNAVNGIATFKDLSIDKPGVGYTLVASSAGLTGATSNLFNIDQAATSCQQNLSCTTNASNPTTAASITSNGPGDGVQTLSLDTGSDPGAGGQCAGVSYVAAGPDWINFFVSDTTRSKIATMKADTPADQEVLGPGGDLDDQVQVCFAAPYPFTTAAGTQAKLISGEYVGLLPSCPSTGPCMQPIIDDDRSNPPTTTVKVAIPAGEPGDPRMH